MAPKKPPAGFNTPFRELKAPPKPVPSVPPPPPPAPAQVPSKQEASDDARLFEQAMRGVTPLSSAERRRRAAPLVAPAAVPSRADQRAQARRDDAMAEADLSELVARPGRLAVEEVGETVTAWADGVDRRVLRRLSAGEYPVEAQVDLHGLTRDAAAATLDRTVRRAHADGRRCLLVVHGRGLNSGDEGPVLKPMVVQALSQGPLARLVLAFTSARPDAGGAGALLILLRKARG
jgi:DNA-nicking Smr family endonuclease